MARPVLQAIIDAASVGLKRPQSRDLVKVFRPKFLTFVPTPTEVALVKSLLTKGFDAKTIRRVINNTHIFEPNVIPGRTITRTELLTALDQAATIPGSQTVFKRLTINSSQVKGIAYELFDGLEKGATHLNQSFKRDARSDVDIRLPNGSIVQCKNVSGTLSLDKKLSDWFEFAKAEVGDWSKVELHVPSGTTLTGPLTDFVTNKGVILVFWP